MDGQMASGDAAGPVEDLRVATILAAAAWHWRLIEVFFERSKHFEERGDHRSLTTFG
jgi:hypothetical protein